MTVDSSAQKAARLAAATRRAQGLPDRVSDLGALGAVAALADVTADSKATAA